LGYAGNWNCICNNYVLERENMKLTYKGAISVFVLLMLGLVIALYMFGFKSAFLTELSNEFRESDSNPLESVTSFLNILSGSIISAFTEHLDITLPMLGFGFLAGATGGSYASGSVFRFLVPVLILFAIVNIFIFPVIPAIETEIASTSEFSPLVAILSVILNCFMFLTILEFVTERS
jgi:hypothetical protein